MATLVVRDAENLLRYLEVEGAGTEADPFVPVQRVREVLHAAFFTAQVLVGTANQIVQLPSQPLTVGVYAKALSGNQGRIYIGDAGVTVTTGFELDKNQAILIRVDQLNKLYITSSANNEGISVIGL